MNTCLETLPKVVPFQLIHWKEPVQKNDSFTSALEFEYSGSGTSSQDFSNEEGKAKKKRDLHIQKDFSISFPVSFSVHAQAAKHLKGKYTDFSKWLHN